MADERLTRSPQYVQGHRAAWKEAVTWLHKRAAGMNDPSARAVLNVAADDMGRAGKRRHRSPEGGTTHIDSPNCGCQVKGNGDG